MKGLIKLLIVVFSIIYFTACERQAPTIATNTVNLQNYTATGVIKKIDPENGKITIDHEDIKGYMSAMEMDFSVADKLSLNAIKVGDKVDFEIERKGEKLTITKLNKIGEVAILNGAEIYKTSCATCHGDKGEGTKKGIPLISGHALHHTETEHIKQVTDGESEKMPAFRETLSAEQIKVVVDFVRSNLQKNSKRDDSHKHKH